jgi:transcription elongation factor Elf1
MVKFNENWMESRDDNGDKLKEWAKKLDDKYFSCTWCNGNKCIYSVIGKQAFSNHAKTKKHKLISCSKNCRTQLRIRIVKKEEKKGDTTAGPVPDLDTSSTSQAKEKAKHATSIELYMPKETDASGHFILPVMSVKHKD